MNTYSFKFISKDGDKKNTFAIAENIIRAIEIMTKKHEPLLISQVVFENNINDLLL